MRSVILRVFWKGLPPDEIDTVLIFARAQFVKVYSSRRFNRQSNVRASNCAATAR